MKNRHGEFEVFEIKTPEKDKPVLSLASGARSKLSAKLESYVSQASEYAEFIKSDAQARSALTDLFSVEKATTCTVRLLHGFDHSDFRHRLNRILSQRSPRIEVLDYSQLFNLLITEYDKGRVKPLVKASDVVGVDLVMAIRFKNRPEGNAGYIAGFGSDAKSTMMVRINGDSIVVEVQFESGATKKVVDAPVKLDNWIVLNVEAGGGTRGSYVSVGVNGDEVAYLKSASPKKFSL